MEILATEINKKRVLFALGATVDRKIQLDFD